MSYVTAPMSRFSSMGGSVNNPYLQFLTHLESSYPQHMKPQATSQAPTPPNRVPISGQVGLVVGG